PERGDDDAARLTLGHERSLLVEYLDDHMLVVHMPPAALTTRMRHAVPLLRGVERQCPRTEHLGNERPTSCRCVGAPGKHGIERERNVESLRLVSKQTRIGTAAHHVAHVVSAHEFEDLSSRN